MSNSSGPFSSPPLVALCSWLVPGSGYFLIGQRLRGATIGITIIVLFVLGILFAGIRVIDVPGFDDHGVAIYVNASGQKVPRAEQGRWALMAKPFSEIANKPWFVGQILTGPMCLLAAHWSLDLAHGLDANGKPLVPRSHGRISEIGTLYTAVAGMLNLLAVIDSAYRAGREAGR